MVAPRFPQGAYGPYTQAAVGPTGPTFVQSPSCSASAWGPQRTRRALRNVGLVGLTVLALWGLSKIPGCVSSYVGKPGSYFSFGGGQDGNAYSGSRWGVYRVGGAEVPYKINGDGSMGPVLDIPDDVRERDIDRTGSGQPRVRLEDPRRLVIVHDMTNGAGRVVSQERGSPIGVRP